MAAETPAPWRIIALEAENFAKLKAVSIRPDGSLVQITGKNRNGKTSVLNAMWAALGGERKIPVEPIRHGEERARIRLEIGNERPELIVTRTFIAQDGGEFTTALKVENGEGARFPKGQEVLNALLGSISFDPLAFTRMDDEKRLALLRPLVKGVDFDALTAANTADFQARTVQNSKAKSERTLADSVAIPPGPVPQRVDVADLQAEYEGAAQFNATLETRRARRAAAKAEIDRAVAEEAELRAKLDALIAHREGLEEAFANAEALPEPKDLLVMREKLANANATNAHADAAERRAAHAKAATAAEEAAAALTKAIEKRKADMASAVAKAVCTVPGLAFQAMDEGEGRITLGGAPFDQASDAEQLEASILIAALLNPRLRVIRVRDGSLLDEDALAALGAMAERLDLQVWIERVDSSGAVGFVLEDGELKGPGTSPAPRNPPPADDEPEEAV